MKDKNTGTEIAPFQEQENLLPADPMVTMIERVVLDPEADISKLEKMLEMRERIEDRARDDQARAAHRAFIQAHASAQAEVPLIKRTRRNDHSKYNYADLADIETQAMPIIRKHGFSVTAWPGPGAADGMQRVHLRVAHIEGHVDEICDDFPIDGSGLKGGSNKTAVQAKGSTTTYGRRYLLCGYFGIATADNDGSRIYVDPKSETISAKDAMRIRELIESSGADEVRFLKTAKVGAVDDIAARDVQRLIALLERKQKEAANA